ncbi:MAG: ATP-binding protein [Patescibacteria group bacterium]
MRDCVEYILQSFNLVQKDIARYVLACDEMNNNAIEHGSSLGDSNTLRIKINKSEKKISLDIQVQDSGNGKTAKSAEQMNECKNKRSQIDFTKHNSIRGR